MEQTTKKVFGVVAILFAVVFGWLVHVGGHQAPPQPVGSDTITNPQWFSTGFKFGNLNALYSSDKLTVVAGSDQVEWTNNTGQDVFVYQAPLFVNATSSNAIASSTVWVSVGATTTSAIAEPYKTGWIVQATTPLLINNLVIATSSQIGNRTYAEPYLLLGDNYKFTGNASTTALLVPAGWKLFMKVDSQCIAEGICETATSTAIGYSSITLPFRYYYDSPN